MSDVYVRIRQGSSWAEKTMLGNSVRGHLVCELFSAGLPITFNKQADFAEEEYIAVVYDDMAFLSAEALTRAVQMLKASGADGFRLGDGVLMRRTLARAEGDFLSAPGINCERVTDSESFTRAYQHTRRKTVREHQKNGVIFYEPDTVHIDAGVTIGEGSEIYGNCYFCGDTVIGKDCIVRAGTTLTDAKLADGVRIEASRVDGSSIGARTTVGPNAYVRGGSAVGADVRLGDFVEIKHSILHDGVKCAHLSYVGDAEVGSRTNIGCGVVFANYNGKIKQRTRVGEGVFIGSNVNLVAPLTIGDGAYIAAGSTVTESLKDESFCIARSKQTVKENYKIIR